MKVSNKKLIILDRNYFLYFLNKTETDKIENARTKEITSKPGLAFPLLLLEVWLDSVEVGSLVTVVPGSVMVTGGLVTVTVFIWFREDGP